LEVPLLEGETVLGVLSLECDHLNGFDQDAVDALLALAELAVIAIQNTSHYQELKEARATVGNITAVAWMGLVASAWRHSIGNLTTTISDYALLALMDLERGVPAENIKPRLKMIQEIVEEIQKIPMPPLSSESGIEPIYLCQLVRDRISQFRNKKAIYGDINFDLKAEIDELSMVRVSPEWLRRILDVLIDNARLALKNSPDKWITTQILPKNEGVEILISDTGTGIRESTLSALFKNPIHKEKGEKGSGIGLFLAYTVIRVYGGYLEVHSTGPLGTTMAIWLPLLKE
jgi:signal transduction histidine kinase